MTRLTVERLAWGMFGFAILRETFCERLDPEKSPQEAGKSMSKIAP